MVHIKRIDEMFENDLGSFLNNFFTTQYIIYDKNGEQIEWFDNADDAIDYFEKNMDTCDRIFCQSDERFNDPYLKTVPAKKEDHNKTICIDFDGVLHDYSQGWLGDNVFGKPVENADKGTLKLKEQGWTIIVFTCRGNTPELREWLKKNNITYDYINENPEGVQNDTGKPIADIYLDDHGLKFNGDWDTSIKEIENFESWQQ